MAKVYAISNQVFSREPLVKIGLTTNLDRRKDQLERGQPYPLESIAEIEVPRAYTREVESFLHDALAPLRHDDHLGPTCRITSGGNGDATLVTRNHSQPVVSPNAFPISARLLTVFTPASSSASYFSAAVPLPPAMIAPAWPMRLPGGAVTPAM